MSNLPQLCSELHSDLEEFARSSPVLLMNRRGKVAVQRIQMLLTALADQVRSLEEHEQAARDRDIIIARALVCVAGDDPVPGEVWTSLLVMAQAGVNPR